MEYNELDEMTVEAPEVSNTAEQTKEKNVVNTAKRELSKIKTMAEALIKRLGKKAWIILAAAAIVVAGAVVLLCSLQNTYKTPLNLMEKYLNSRKTPETFREYTYLLNGFAEDELKAVFEAFEDSDYYEENLEKAQDAFEENVETNEFTYGSNYKYSFVIEDKVELEKSELREMREYFRNAADELEELVEESEEWDSDEWEEVAEEGGLTKSQFKKAVKALEKVGKLWRSAEVTKGYELTVLARIEGRELDEPEENETTLYVYKVNGRWICTESFYTALSTLPLF